MNELYLKDLENISNQLGNSEPIKLSEIEKKQEPIERKLRPPQIPKATKKNLCV
ncbi:hypothetical protein LEP1GSC133_2972 [Leptospira borgpetersenii serovar Pomona str. 200901868]|uniref:Uncharacterized protein n=1 Tax=Leptospira borgpetersenii serovar Pomona str. 200901868 TaxID=1192866 RepID=M6WAZ2_LEPBO|nr:hypothetical protein LEP1GSC133_2972 [Leptospira borgpetersenii serovar Pomona str. 200901868]